MVHVDNMAASIAFYEHLGAEIVHGGPGTDRTLLQLGTTQISLVSSPPSPGQSECTVELNFAAAMPLVELERNLRRDGVTIVGAISHTEFGAQLRIRTPDGMVIKINQLEPDSYV